MNRSFIIILLLTSCAAQDPPILQSPPTPPVESIPAPRPPPKPFPLPPPMPSEESTSTTKLTPQEILSAAEQARFDAIGYVAWKRSKPENIDRLATLTLSLDAAVKKMQAGKIGHQYAASDVVGARDALQDLRSFLSNKGD